MIDDDQAVPPRPPPARDEDKVRDALSRQFRGMTARDTHGLAEAMGALGWLAKLGR